MDSIKEALDYAIIISDQHITYQDAVAYAAERWKLDYEILWKAWLERFERKI